MSDILPKTTANQTSWFTTVKARIIAVPRPLDNFPSIPLAIPELQPVTAFLTSRMFLFNFMIGFLLMAMIIVGEDITLNTKRLETARMQRQFVLKRIALWQKVVSQYPGYRDGFYQLALLENQIGNKQAAYTYIKESLTIDPDFTTGKQFAESLSR